MKVGKRVVDLVVQMADSMVAYWVDKKAVQMVASTVVQKVVQMDSFSVD